MNVKMRSSQDIGATHKATPTHTRPAPIQVVRLVVSSPKQRPATVVTRKVRLLLSGTARERSALPRVYTKSTLPSWLSKNGQT
ncbi:hypothetical protein E2C01_007517 [Portunus trituberculatus]|uniref:Uncharacterized protein n=1 Tax=Portunus trituberculatus TaxID=210409 RepID=A0A5B7D2M3_PORTR|nr:hypothetical protein [Portunus trituberculatus]